MVMIDSLFPPRLGCGARRDFSLFIQRSRQSVRRHSQSTLLFLFFLSEGFSSLFFRRNDLRCNSSLPRPRLRLRCLFPFRGQRAADEEVAVSIPSFLPPLRAGILGILSFFPLFPREHHGTATYWEDFFFPSFLFV